MRSKIGRHRAVYVFVCCLFFPFFSSLDPILFLFQLKANWTGLVYHEERQYKPFTYNIQVADGVWMPGPRLTFSLWKLDMIVARWLEFPPSNASASVAFRMFFQTYLFVQWGSFYSVLLFLALHLSRKIVPLYRALFSSARQPPALYLVFWSFESTSNEPLGEAPNTLWPKAQKLRCEELVERPWKV